MTDSAATEASQKTSHSSRWALVLLLLGLLVLGAAVVPPLVNANRLRGRLVSSLSSALGRPVRLDNVSLRLLPRPGLAFENLEVAEEPGFGAEPVIRASSVVVGLRLLPLWRGRMEVATISLNEASVNLARNADGHWNFESVLERTSQLPARLPTGPRRTSAGQRFPYLEVTNGRVNFKRGAEKLPFSFTDAEFSLWLETPTEWRLRFRASPVRTDLDASYTGEFRVEGSITRADAGAGLSGSGLSMHGQWVRAPLGQLTRMMEGTDRGWRGQTTVDFILSGTAAESNVTARVQVDGLRRDDFVPTRVLPLDVNCTGRVAPLRRVVESAACVLPTGAGRVRLIAESGAGNGGPAFDEGEGFRGQLVLEQVPAEWALDVFRVTRQGVSPQLAAGGELNGSFTYDPAVVDKGRPQDESYLRGKAQWQSGTLSAIDLDRTLTIPTVTLDAGAETTPGSRSSRVNSRDRSSVGQRNASAQSRYPLFLRPVAVDMGDVQPLTLSGGFSRMGYAVDMNGSVELGRGASLLRLLGFARWTVLRQVSGNAAVHAQIQGAWMSGPSGAPPAITGIVALASVVAETAWLPGTVILSRGDITFSPDAVKWQGLQWSWAGVKFDGNAQKFAKCEDEAECAWRIVAHTPALDVAQIEAAFSAPERDRVLEYFRESTRGGWPRMQVDLSADALTLAPVTVRHANAGLMAEGSLIKITRLTGEVAGGVVEGNGAIALDSGKTELQLGLAHVSVSDMGVLFHEKWGHGTAEATTSLTLRGGGDVAGTFGATVRDGGWPETPLEHFDSWQMSGSVGDGHISIEKSVAGAGATTESVTGTIGFDRGLNVTVTPGAADGAPVAGAKPVQLGGSVASPQVR